MNSPSARYRMFRQHSQRYSRASLGKGLKVKHVLQIAVIVVVLTWVMYELNLTVKPASQSGNVVFEDAEQDAFLGRKALKPEGGPGKVEKDVPTEVPKDLATDRHDTERKSSQEENYTGSRTEEDSDDQGDRDISELDIEHASEQDEKSEDEALPNDVQHDVGTDFEELKNEQARVEQEEGGKDDEDSASHAQEDEATTSDDSDTEGGSDDADHLMSAAEKEKRAREASIATFMDAFNADSILKPKLDKLDEGKTDNTSRVSLDEKRDSATNPLKETSEDPWKEAVQEKSVDQNEQEKSVDRDEEIGEKDAEDEIADPSEVTNKTKNHLNNQFEVKGTERILGTQSEGQLDANRETTEDVAESNEERKVDEGEHGTEPHLQEQEERKQEQRKQEQRNQEQSKQEQRKQEKGVEENAGDMQTEVKTIENNRQPELKSEGADVEAKEKVDESEASEGDKNKPLQSEGADDQIREKERFAAGGSIQEFLGTSTEKEETEQGHSSEETKIVSEPQQDDTEQKKDESMETTSVKHEETHMETHGESAKDSSDSSEKTSQEDRRAETVNPDSSTSGDSKKKDEFSKVDTTLKQVTDSNSTGRVDSNIENPSVKKPKESDPEVAQAQQEQAQK